MTDMIRDLLTRADAYLTAIHIARHDVIGEGHSCAGCELRGLIRAELAVSAAAPSADRATLRDRIAEALYERERPPRDPHWAKTFASDRETFEAMADAVLSVLPAPAEDHRLSLADALGLGTGAPWEAIHDRATELGLPPLDQDPVARRLGLLPAPDGRAAVLEEAADAVFALDYDDLVSEQDDENLGSMREAWDLGTIHAMKLLRRLAAEAPATTQASCGCPHPADEHSVYGCADGCGCEWMPKKPPMDPVRILGIADCPTPLTHNWGCGCPTDQLPLHAESGVDTPGCDCGHDGMGPKWHGKPCAWLATLTVPHPDDAPAVVEPAEAADTETTPTLAYSGKGRTFCVTCTHPDDEDVPLTIDEVSPWDRCRSCGRFVVDVARAAAEAQQEAK